MWKRLLSTVKVQVHAQHGKKIKPEKPNIVMLDLKQSGLLPLHRHRYARKPPQQHNISFLEGVDFDDSGKLPSTPHVHSQPHQYSELLKFSDKATTEQVVQSIDSLKVPTTRVSRKIFNDVVAKLVDRYTVKQLKYYIAAKSNLKCTSHIVKLKLATKIVQDVWNVQVAQGINSITYATRTINLTHIQTKLLLLTQNGKILKNLSRLDKNLLIQLDLLNDQLRLWGNDSILKYIEISINEVLKNISVTPWCNTHSHPPLHNSNSKIISRITRLCGVDINLHQNEIAAFGWKRIQLAKRLLLWSDYNNMQNNNNSVCKQTVDKVEVTPRASQRWFPFSETQNLNWVQRIEPLQYLHKVTPIANAEVSLATEAQTAVANPEVSLAAEQTAVANKLANDDQKIDNIYNFFTKTPGPSRTSSVVSISLGQILKSNQSPVNTSPWIFQSKVPQLSQRLMKLPLDNPLQENDELLSLDQHDYYIQIILIPSCQPPEKDPSSSNDTFPRKQPLELWLQLDENDQIIMDSIQAIIPTLRENYLIQTPQLPCDYKISNDHIMNIPVTLETQPQLISFLNDIHTGNNIDNYKIPSELTLNNPASTENDSIKYNFVSCNKHKILKLKYMDKYSVQYSEIDGGELGEKSQQIDFIANEPTPSKEELKQFITDVLKF